MVGDVVVADVAEDGSSYPTVEGPVASGQCTTDERPLGGAVAREGGVGVVKVGEKDDMVVAEDVGDEVHLDDCDDACVVSPKTKEEDHNDEPYVGQNDIASVTRFEERRGWTEVL